jgi:TonB family protein
MISVSILLICMVRLAAGWFPLTGAPLAAQEQNSEAEVRSPQKTTIQVAGDVQESKLIFKVEPIYPEEAKRVGLNGIVRLRVYINEEGQVSRIVTQAGHPMLIKSAFDAVTKWRYSPTLLNGDPVSVVTNVTCYFLNKETAAFWERTGDAKPSVSTPRTSVPGSVVGGMTERPKAAVPPPAREPIADNPIKPPRTEPIRIGNMVQESKLIHRVEPVYPEQAKSIGLQGVVKLSITINEEGFVYELKVESGHPILVEAAIEAVKQWQYSPTLLNGEPVAAQTTVTVVFNLK